MSDRRPAIARRPSPATAATETRLWVEEAVIGLGLCPFARPVHASGRLRIVVSPAADAEALLAALVEELHRLQAANPAELETTLLVHPSFGLDFETYNDFLDIADAALEALDLEGEIQVASFHPDYQFADSDPDDIENASNRSPWPTLHLLREASVEQAVASLDDPASIYERNRRTLQDLGDAGWQALQQRCRDEARAELARSCRLRQAGAPDPA